MRRIRRLFRRERPEDVEMTMKKRLQSNEYSATEHHVSIANLSKQFGTLLDQQDIRHSAGLPSSVASQRLQEEGKNILSPPKTTPELLKFLLHFTNFFMLLLLFAATMSCITYGIDNSQETSLYVGIFLYGVVLLDCTISYIQERASSNVMKTFSRMLPQKAKVIRDGQEREVGVEELVRGDLIKFAIGDKIPADLRVVFNQQAKVECSSITGESIPIALSTEKTHERPSESRNLVFNGSLCLNGEAYGVVIRTGDHTLIGEIAKLAGAQSQHATTLQKEIQHFVKFIGALSSCTALIFFIVGMARGQRFLDTFVNGFIVVILAFLPCGLPTAVTSIISICAKKMAKKNVYVKRLDIVETLGSTSLIASDKTGTLTQNVMTLVSFWFDGQQHDVQHTGGPNGALLIDLLETPTFKVIIQCSSLCNRARYSDEAPASSSPSSPSSPPLSRANSDEDLHSSNQRSHSPEVPKDRTILGDASDAAIFRFFNHLNLVDRQRRQHRKIFEVPFNSSIKHSIVIIENPLTSKAGEVIPRHTLYLKGAPEVVLDKCSHVMMKGERLELTPELHHQISSALRRSAAVGERVLALSGHHLETIQESYTEEPANYPTTGLTFLGLVSLVDPPRPNVPEAIKTLKKASVKVLMVTGDHPVTAEAIARQVNIIGDGKTRAEVAAMQGIPMDHVPLSDSAVQAVVVTGSELMSFTEEMWSTVLSKKEIVFARTTPTQKLEIVERNQALGHIVAVTGDGVNDSPALKAANVGVAMGKMGSDVAREAADIILITDDFAAILDAVKMGRLMFDNLRKTIAYTLPHVLPEVIPVLCTLAFSLPLGLNSILILCIDMGTEMFPSVSLAFEKPESNIMARKPRNVNKDKMASHQVLLYSYLVVGVAQTLVCFAAFLLTFIFAGIPVSSLPGTYGTYWTSTSTPFNVTVTSDGREPFTLDASEQVDLNEKAQAAYFMTLILCQFWHVWFARTSRASTFRRRPRNLVMIMGTIISVGLMVIIVYIPGLQPYVGTRNPDGVIWAFNLIFLAFILPYSEITKLLARLNKKGFFSRHLVW